MNAMLALSERYRCRVTHAITSTYVEPPIIQALQTDSCLYHETAPFDTDLTATDLATVSDTQSNSGRTADDSQSDSAKPVAAITPGVRLSVPSDTGS